MNKNYVLENANLILSVRTLSIAEKITKNGSIYFAKANLIVENIMQRLMLGKIFFKNNKP